MNVFNPRLKIQTYISQVNQIAVNFTSFLVTQFPLSFEGSRNNINTRSSVSLDKSTERHTPVK